VGIRISKASVTPFYTQFFKDIPEIGHLFDVKQMIKDGTSFDFRAYLTIWLNEAGFHPTARPEF